MKEADLKALFDAVSKGKIDTSEAMSRFRDIPGVEEGAAGEDTPDVTVTDLVPNFSEERTEVSKAPEGMDDQEAPTVVMPIPEFAKETTFDPSGGDAEESLEEDLGKFSETSWFMAATDLEELGQDTENVKIDEEKYRRDEDLEAEIRKKFSLRETDDTE